MQSKIIKKLKSFLSYSLKLFILTSFLLSQSFIAEIFLYQNNPDTKSINTAQANYSDPWYNTNWSYRKPITIHSSEVSHTTEASQSNFPVLVSFIDPNFRTTTHGGKVQNDPNGYDIIFVGQDGTTQTQLDHEMEKYDPTTGEIVAWVKMPTLSSVSDTTFYVYYGNSAINATQEHKNNVWNDGIVGGGNFKGVWHLSDTPSGHAIGDYKDSTINVNNSTNTTNEPTPTTSGQIDGAQSFDRASGNYVDAGIKSNLRMTSSITMEAWIKPSAINITQGFIWRSASYGVYITNNGYLSSLVDVSNSAHYCTATTNKAVANTWLHVVATYDGSNMLLYQNGALVQTTPLSGSIYDPPTNLYLGNQQYTSNYFNGIIDEVRISDTARSVDWIKTEYNNQSSPSSFCGLGEEEDILPPVIAEVTAVSTPTINTNPSYIFSSTKPGIITYGGDCSSSITSAVSGNNTITFNTLSAGTHSDCTIKVRDGLGNWSNELTVKSFTIVAVVPTSWYDASWLYRRQITIDYTKIPHTDTSNTNSYLNNFPVLISISNDPNLKNSIDKVAKPDGSDIIFTPQTCVSSFCNELNYEIENYDSTNGNLTAWVKIPQLNDANNTQSTTIYMYYGNNNASANTQANVNTVWDSNFKGVWHLGDTPSGHAVGDYKDSTVNANNSINTTNEPTATTSGQIDGAQSFDRTNSNYVDVGIKSNLRMTSSITMEAWIKPSAVNIPQAFIWRSASYGISITNNGYLSSMIDVNNGANYCTATTNKASANTWLHVVAVYNGSNILLYQNGVLVQTASLSGSIYDPSTVLYLGNQQYTSNYFNGAIDEVRVSDTARSADWIAAEYNNESNAGTFYALGSEESTIVATPIFSPISGTYIYPQTVTLSTTTPNAIIYYTIDGTTPTVSSPVYSSPIAISSTTTIKAIATASGYSTSFIGSALFTITPPVSTPTFSPATDTYISSQTVNVSTATPNATIYYTTDGTDPNISSAVYSSPLTVSSTTVIKAIAIASGYSTSVMGSALFTIADQDVTVYVVSSITDNKILPTSSISSSYISNTISAKASPGELEAASFVVHANEDIDSMSVEPTNLTGSGGTISSANVDIRTVKCWYQGNYTSGGLQDVGRYLTPELLLKDDGLIQVSGEDWAQWNIPNPNGKNYIKLTDGSYIDISSGTQDVNSTDIIPISERPIQDSATLQPINLSANYNKQFWITLRVPNNVNAGNYSGTITLRNGTEIIRQLQLNLRVLPITLSSPNIEYSLYYRGKIANQGSISSENKTVQQYTAEQQDMLDHGVANPTVYPAGNDELLKQMLSIRNQIGLNNTNLYYLGLGSGSASLISYYQNLTAPYGVRNIYAYFPDEQDLNGPGLRSSMTAIHDAGGKVFDAQDLFQADSVADILDLAIVATHPSITLANKYHTYNHRIFSYNNPHTSPEYPKTFRMNYGLVLWQSNYDGAMDYVYQHSFGDIWNDFDNTAYRDQVFAYPTMNGVVDTIQWEGFREGVDDVRYLATLQNTITVANSQGKDTSEAENYLVNLKNSDLTNQDLDAIRSQMINYILILTSSAHILTINQGTGSSAYEEGQILPIVANVPQAGMVFDKWVGDTSYVANVNSASTTVTMPAHAISLSATYKVLSSPLPDSWYDNNYSYLKAITIDHNKVANTDQFNFPVLIPTTDTAFKTISKGGKINNLNGYDIVFTSKSGTKLDHEIESYDGVNGTITMWVKIPVLSHIADTTIYMYYGNPNITTSRENKTAVWDDGGDNNFKGVWHMNQNPAGATPQISDSTSNHNNGTSGGSMTAGQVVAGQVGSAISFDGSNDYINIGNLGIPTNGPVTLSGWYKFNIFAKNRNRSENLNGVLYQHSVNNFLYFMSGTDFFAASALDTNNWHYISLVYNGTHETALLYIDGTRESIQIHSPNTSTTSSFRISGSSNSFDGLVDEYRVSNINRSADWIVTEYNNQSSPSTFSIMRLEETILPPTITSLSANLPNGTYGTGTTIPITINFSKDVTSTGNITLTLNTIPQRTCSFTITNNNSATCNYTIQGGDSATNLNATISGTIQDQFGNPLTNFTPTSNLSDNTTININTSSSPFTPPTKPNITNINITVLDNGTTTFNLPSNITQIAISRTPDFANVSWQDFDQDKFSHINETQETLYLKFRTNEGAVSDTIIITPQTSINNTISLTDGDIIQCKSSNDPNAVYIVKIIGTKTYIRHITSIRIFNYYKHLKWENLKQVDSLTPFSLSSWIRVNTGTNGLPKAEDKVYEINGDQTKHWINMTSNQFLSHGGSDEAIYTVNTGELNLYSAGADVVSL